MRSHPSYSTDSVLDRFTACVALSVLTAAQSRKLVGLFRMLQDVLKVRRGAYLTSHHQPRPRLRWLTAVCFPRLAARALLPAVLSVAFGLVLRCGVRCECDPFLRSTHASVSELIDGVGTQRDSGTLEHDKSLYRIVRYAHTSDSFFLFTLSSSLRVSGALELFETYELDVVPNTTSFPAECSCEALRREFVRGGFQPGRAGAPLTEAFLKLYPAHPHQRLCPEQEAVVRMELHGTSVIQALAGTGKTSTLLYLMLARPQVRFLFVCFNRG
jgi:hypothetical protein